MKRSEDIRKFLQRMSNELAKNQNDIKKAKKRITRLNKAVKALRSRIKSHRHDTAAAHAHDSSTIRVAAPADGKKTRSALLLRIQADWEKKPQQTMKGRRRIRHHNLKGVTHKKRAQAKLLTKIGALVHGKKSHPA